MSNESQRVYLSNKMSKLALGLPVKMPNLDFDFPKNSPYAEFWIMGTKGIPISGEGTNKIKERFPGMIQLTVWVPDGKGTKASSVAIDKFIEAFEYRTGRDAAGSSYEFKGSETFTPDTKQGWSVTIARISFRRDEVKKVGQAL